MALKIILGIKDWKTIREQIEYCNGNDTWFEEAYKKEWVNDPFIRRVIREVDNAEPVLDGNVFHNFITGDYHSKEGLSTGCKTIICIYKFPEVVFRARYGKNCLPFLEEIAVTRDVLVHDFYVHFYDFEKLGSIELVNYNHKKIYSERELNQFYRRVYEPYERLKPSERPAFLEKMGY